jgi:hypothetical protein
MDPRLAELRRNYQHPGQAEDAAVQINNVAVVQRHLVLRTPAEAGRDHQHFAVDTLFPKAVVGHTDTASIDEGTADLLYGLVRGVQPQVVLETGTHKGRSTRALATALRDNAEIEMMAHSYTGYLPTKGHLYTIDVEDHHIFESGALPDTAKPYVTHLIGWTPDLFTTNPYLKDLAGINFAFLDGDHTPEGLAAELAYVDAHRAPECWVAVDNSRDGGWPKIRAFLAGYTTYPRISLATCTGLDLIWMSDSARSPRVETAKG